MRINVVQVRVVVELVAASSTDMFADLLSGAGHGSFTDRESTANQLLDALLCARNLEPATLQL